MTCSIENCSRKVEAKKMCRAHYRLYLAISATKCLIENCDRPSTARGLCKLHHFHKQNGKTLKPIPHRSTKPLPKDIQAKIRKQSGLAWIKNHSIFLAGRRYPAIDVWYARLRKKKRFRIHRLVMEKKLGRFLLPGEVVHHENHNLLDCRPKNLALFPSHSEHMKQRNHRRRGPRLTVSRKAPVAAA